jgi:hypothetical protein
MGSDSLQILTTIRTSVDELWVTRHVGKNLRDVVQAGIERALKKVSYFADKWS